jgi:hypothetical protein
MAAGKKPDQEMRGRLVSVFGPFNSRALVEVSAELALELVGDEKIDSCGRGVVDAVDRDLAEIRKRYPAVADSALGAAARSLALELENPYNSLTSKAMATRELREDLDRLRELAPPMPAKDALDEVAEKREGRLRDAGIAAASD